MSDSIDQCDSVTYEQIEAISETTELDYQRSTFIITESPFDVISHSNLIPLEAC